MSAAIWLTGCSRKKKLLSDSRRFDLSGANNLSASKQGHLTSTSMQMLLGACKSYDMVSIAPAPEMTKRL